MEDHDLTQKIIGCAFKVHNALGPGFLEKVYENALRIELEKLGLADRWRPLVEFWTFDASKAQVPRIQTENAPH